MDLLEKWENFKMENFSVLISVYQKEKPENLDQSLESIWSKQTLKPNEIILVQDGPLNQDLDKVIYKWERIIGENFTTLKLPKNSGLANALNQGLKICSYEIIARMDSDDISLPDRFEKQISHMTKNKDIVVCSGQIEEWDADLKNKIGERKVPLTKDKIISFAKSRSPINHPCAAFRKSILLENHGYPEIYPEDYALWGILLAKGHEFSNLACTLLKMRAGDSISQRRGFAFLKGEIKVFKLLNQLKFISKFQMYKNIISRTFLRLSPNFVKKLAYKILR